jgi:hypothetical protein
MRALALACRRTSPPPSMRPPPPPPFFPFLLRPAWARVEGGSSAEGRGGGGVGEAGNDESGAEARMTAAALGLRPWEDGAKHAGLARNGEAVVEGRKPTPE